MTDIALREMVENQDVDGLVDAISDHDYYFTDPRRKAYLDEVSAAIRELAGKMGAPFWTESLKYANHRHRNDGATLSTLIECADVNAVEGGARYWWWKRTNSARRWRRLPSPLGS